MLVHITKKDRLWSTAEQLNNYTQLIFVAHYQSSVYRIKSEQ